MNWIFKDISSHAAYGLWHVSESLQELDDSLNEKLPSGLVNYHPNKKKEYLASRILMRQLCEYLKVPYGGITKDENGKPHLTEGPCHISISHAYPYVVCMLDKLQPCGIDIETPRQQLIKVKHKFLNQSEQEQAGGDLNLLCRYWSAKEALYKIRGKKRLVFAENLNVDMEKTNTFSGKIITDGSIEIYNLRWEVINDHFLVYNV